jgi:hypothetical protein
MSLPILHRLRVELSLILLLIFCAHIYATEELKLPYIFVQFCVNGYMQLKNWSCHTSVHIWIQLDQIIDMVQTLQLEAHRFVLVVIVHSILVFKYLSLYCSSHTPKFSSINSLTTVSFSSSSCIFFHVHKYFLPKLWI